MTRGPFEVELKRAHAGATGGRWWPVGVAAEGVDIVAGPHLGDTTMLFHGEWERCVDASLLALLRNHAEQLADLVAAAREWDRCRLERQRAVIPVGGTPETFALMGRLTEEARQANEALQAALDALDAVDGR